MKYGMTPGLPMGHDKMLMVKSNSKPKQAPAKQAPPAKKPGAKGGQKAPPWAGPGKSGKKC